MMNGKQNQKAKEIKKAEKELKPKQVQVTKLSLEDIQGIVGGQPGCGHRS